MYACCTYRYKTFQNTPVRDLVCCGMVLQLDPRGVVLGDESLRLPLVDVPVVEQLVDHLAVLNQHVFRRNLDRTTDIIGDKINNWLGWGGGGMGGGIFRCCFASSHG